MSDHPENAAPPTGLSGAGGSLPKYYILEYGDASNENTLHVFDTADERDAKTRELIFGDAHLSNPDDADAWDKYREELNDSGNVRFEGDPGIDWFTAHPARTEANKPSDNPQQSG